MLLWKVTPRPVVWDNHPAMYDDVVFKRGLCAWVLPLHIAVKVMKFNERHLPVVIRKPTNEDYYLRLSIRRILNGYRTYRLANPWGS